MVVAREKMCINWAETHLHILSELIITNVLIYFNLIIRRLAKRARNLEEQTVECKRKMTQQSNSCGFL